MSIPSFRVFFDTSVYIAALISNKGAAAELLRLSEAGIIQMVVSEEVIVESDRVLQAKFPELIDDSRRLWKSLKPQVVLNSRLNQIKPFVKLLDKSDAAILCAASHADVAAFVTWNTKDFMKPKVAALVSFPIVVPADCLVLFRKWLEPFLN